MTRVNSGLFIPSTQVWDVDEINRVDVQSKEFKELLVRLYQNLNRMAVAVNLKDSAIYDTSEFVNGQTFFPNPTLTSASATTPVMRQVYRFVVNFGALPNAATKNVAHRLTINGAYTFTRIYGTASDPVGSTYIPLPYAASVLNDNIELYVDGTNVSITTAADYSAYTACYVVLEYIKQ